MTSIESLIIKAKDLFSSQIDDLQWACMKEINQRSKESGTTDTNVQELQGMYAALNILREYIQTGIDPEEIELKVKQRRSFIDNVNESLGH